MGNASSKSCIKIENMDSVKHVVSRPWNTSQPMFSKLIHGPVDAGKSSFINSVLLLTNNSSRAANIMGDASSKSCIKIENMDSVKHEVSRPWNTSQPMSSKLIHGPVDVGKSSFINSAIPRTNNSFRATNIMGDASSKSCIKIENKESVKHEVSRPWNTKIENKDSVKHEVSRLWNTIHISTSRQYCYIHLEGDLLLPDHMPVIQELSFTLKRIIPKSKEVCFQDCILRGGPCLNYFNKSFCWPGLKKLAEKRRNEDKENPVTTHNVIIVTKTESMEDSSKHSSIASVESCSGSIHDTEEFRELEQMLKCKVCLDADLCTVFLPCRHMAVCERCADVLEHCPVCRATIENSIELNFE